MEIPNPHIPFKFRPKLLDTLRGYNLNAFFSDLGAGVIVGIVALPLAMAFAIASGVKPEAGIFTAIVAGFIISAFGGSKVQIGGPTGAFVVIISGVVAKYGMQALLICTMMAGVMLVIMSVMKMGFVIKFIPRPVTIGFTNGIAVIIFSTQIKDFFGLEIENMPSDFFGKMEAIFGALNTIDWRTTLVAAISICTILFWPVKWRKRVPGSVVALVVGTLFASITGLEIATIGSTFGGIPDSLPAFSMPEFKWADLQGLIVPSLTIAILAAIESLLSAVVADGMIEDKHDSNQELMAQGIANIVSPLFGGIPATGAIARTATNVKNGAKTPIAGIIHSITLLVILLVFAPCAKYIPMSCLAAILFVVSYNMGDWREFLVINKMTKSDALVFIITFALTVIFDLTIAVEVGMLLAAFLFIRRIADSTHIDAFDRQVENLENLESLEGYNIPRGVMIFRVFGALMFGAADKLDGVLRGNATPPKVVILRMRTVMALDTTAINALERLHSKIRATGAILLLSGTHSQPLQMIYKSGLAEIIGEENICQNIHIAVERADKLIALMDAEEIEEK
ncbi:SulP family inorganic anion transporter [Intestinicryptomonas porci]|uniref:Sulfate permease n=1 Tax=Intestinicryptomonas porci TaxID=2926320 RepID=A0ABU4WEU8_9BACT|nr:sulfate permease [Opitutales bacterium CLA-KB-P66]